MNGVSQDRLVEETDLTENIYVSSFNINIIFLNINLNRSVFHAVSIISVQTFTNQIFSSNLTFWPLKEFQPVMTVTTVVNYFVTLNVTCHDVYYTFFLFVSSSCRNTDTLQHCHQSVSTNQQSNVSYNHRVGTGSDGLTDTTSGRFVLPHFSTVCLQCVRCHVPWTVGHCWTVWMMMCSYQDILWHWVKWDRWCRHDSLCLDPYSYLFEYGFTLVKRWVHWPHHTSSQEQKCGIHPCWWDWNRFLTGKWEVFCNRHDIHPCSLFPEGKFLRPVQTVGDSKRWKKSSCVLDKNYTRNPL